MLQHVSELEDRMMQELKSYIGVFHLARAGTSGRGELQC